MGWWTDPGSQAGPPHSQSNTVGRRLASPKGGQEDVKEQVEKKRREKRKEMQKAGSHEGEMRGVLVLLVHSTSVGK